MDDTRTNREKREIIISDCLKKLVDLEATVDTAYNYEIETWTKDDDEPIKTGKSGIQITVCW
jgi:hypothetical protein